MTMKTLQELQWRNTNVESSDKILQLKPMEGKKVVNSGGFADSRLWKGENHLHAVCEGTLWKVRLEHGDIPNALKQHWTTFSRCLVAVKNYYEKLNIEVTEVVG